MKSCVDYLKGYGYFIEVHGYMDIPINGDSEIAKLCGMSLEEYKRSMRNEFGARTNNYMNEVFFKNRKNAEKALEWAESRIILHNLIGDN